MTLVNAAIVPHSPILIPTIGRENFDSVKNTKNALEELEKEIYQHNIDTIIILSSPHENISDNYLINHSPNLIAKFESFGDMETKLEFKNDLELGYKIRERTETTFGVNLTSENELSHNFSVPLYYLSKHLKNLLILPISYSKQTYQNHFEFGRVIRKIINESNKRIIVIATGDLSHKLTKEAPGGFSNKAKDFDNLILKTIKNRKLDKLTKIDTKVVKEAEECILNSLVLLAGILDKTNYKSNILSYEFPFGVGYLVANLII